MWPVSCNSTFTGWGLLKFHSSTVRNRAYGQGTFITLLIRALLLTWVITLASYFFSSALFSVISFSPCLFLSLSHTHTHTHRHLPYQILYHWGTHTHCPALCRCLAPRFKCSSGPWFLSACTHSRLSWRERERAVCPRAPLWLFFSEGCSCGGPCRRVWSQGCEVHSHSHTLTHTLMSLGSSSRKGLQCNSLHNVALHPLTTFITQPAFT